MAFLVSFSGVPGAWRASVATLAGLTAVAVGSVGLPAAAQPVTAIPAPAAQGPAAAAESERTEGGYLWAPDAVSARGVARLTGELVEVLGERTVSSQTFALPDGRLVSQQGSGPVWARVGDGDGSAAEDWAPIDVSLTAVDGVVEPVASPVDVVLSGGGDGSAETPVVLASVTDPGSGVVTSASWPGSLPAPTLVENRATYADVSPGLDVVVQVSASGFEQFYVAHDQAALEAAAGMPLTVTAQGGVLASEAGGLEVTDGQGQVVAGSATPVAWDATVDGLLQGRSVLADPAPVATPQLAPLPSVEELLAGGSAGAEVVDAGDVGAYGGPDAGRVSPDQTGAQGPGLGSAPQESLDLQGEAPEEGRAPDAADPLAAGTAGVAVLDSAVRVTGASSAVVDVSEAVDLGAVESTVFPVVIDPSAYVFAGFDAYVQSGTSYDTSAEPELRLGTFDGGRTVARSYVWMPLDGLAGARVSYAEFWLTSTHSYSCQARDWELWGTAAPWQGMSWGNAPAFAGNNMLWKGSWTTGYGAGCPGSTIKFNVSGVIDWATSSGNDSYTFGIKASNESDTYGWKKFQSAETWSSVPTLLVVYNFALAAPTKPTISPAGSPVDGVVWTSSTTPTISTQVWDPDADAVTVVFQTLANGKVLSQHTVYAVPSGSSASWTLPTGALAEGATYEVRALAQDANNTWAASPSASLIIGQDTGVPAAPVITSGDYPGDGKWYWDAGVAGYFRLASGDATVVSYRTDEGKMPTGVYSTGTVAGADRWILHTPNRVGKHTVWAVAVDRAGNVSAPAKHTFLVGRAGLVSPEPDARVVRRARLQVEWNTGTLESAFSHVKYEWRRGPDDPTVRAIAPGALTTSQGEALTWTGEWAKVPHLGGYVNWDTLTTLGVEGGPVQVRAVVAKDATGAGAATTQWTTITVDPDASGAASDQVGPGSVNLLTGDYRMSATDVSQFGLELVRTTSSRDTDSGYQLQQELAARDANGEYQTVGGGQGQFGGYATASIDTSRFHSGTSSIKVTPDGKGTSNTYAYLGADAGGMRLGLKAGQAYRLSTWIYVPAATGLNPPASGGNRIALVWKNAAGVYESVQSPAASKVDTWHELVVDATIPLGATEAFVRLNSGQTDKSKPVYFDDFSVRALWAPFGLAWSSGSMDHAAGTAYTKVSTPEDGLAVVELTGGEKVQFTRGGSNAWYPEPGAEDLTLTQPDATTWLLTEIDGTLTTFRQQVAGNDWPVLASSPPAAVGQSRHLYTQVNGVQRLNRIIAPIEPGIDGWINPTSGNTEACTTNIPARGCEVIDIEYAQTTTATKDTPGVIAGQVSQASVWTWDGSAMVKTPVAAYRYNASGQLVQVWDPRLESRQVTTYAYDDAGRVTSLTPPGEVPYTFSHGKAGATVTGSGDLIDNSAGRVLAVNRASLVPGSKDELGPVNTTTVVYNVPLTREAGGPYDLQGDALDTWAQKDGPTDATAIYGPQDTPGVNTATSTAPGKDGYKPAVVHYLNSSGREVNTAAPMGKDTPVDGFITTTEYDKHGNTVRTLDATNRLLALGTLPGAQQTLTELGLTGRTPAELSVLLDTRSTYDWQGLDLITTTGPVQRLAVENDPNNVQLLRPRTVNRYDENKPDGAEHHLLTTQTTASIDPFTTDTTAPQNDALIDPIVTANDYNPIDGASPTGPTSGWVHKQATRTIVDAGQPTALTTSVLYDERGRVVESRKPGSDAGSAGTTLTSYYTDGAHTDPACSNRPEWAGLTCKTWSPPATGHDPARMGAALPVTHTTGYNAYRSPTTITVTGTSPAGTLTRTTTTTYDPADRVTKVATTESGPGAGTPMPPIATTYDPATGKAVREAALDPHGNETSAIVREYDTLGGLITYTDSTGAKTTTTYDRWGKPTRVAHSIGTTTDYTYDRAIEPRGYVTKITDSVAGDIAPTWGPDGQLESHTLPGGLTLTIGYDPARVPVSRTYTRTNDNTTIAHDTVVENHRGQWIRHTSDVADRTYTYDRHGRLSQTRETMTDQASTCRIRDYSFDTHGNRTTLTATTGTRHESGTCAGTTTHTATTHDTADRTVTTTAQTGHTWTYDGLGRMTTIPTADGTATATLGYHVNDLAASQQIDGVSKTTWALDAIGRFDTQTTTPWDTNTGAWGTSTTTRNHYDSDGDRPAWITENTTNPDTITRNIDGPTGDLIATTTTTGGRKLLLTDLHGDTLATLPIPDQSAQADWASLRFRANDEYGNPTPLNNEPSTNDRYSWHATTQRTYTPHLGAILMGARLYLPHTGTFTTTDPIPGGNTTAYTYPQDPINQHDLDGQWRKALRKAAARAATWLHNQRYQRRDWSIVKGRAYIVMRKGAPGIHWGGKAGHQHRIEYDKWNKWHYNPNGSNAHLSVRAGFKALGRTVGSLAWQGARVSARWVGAAARSSAGAAGRTAGAFSRGGFVPIFVPSGPLHDQMRRFSTPNAPLA